MNTLLAKLFGFDPQTMSVKKEVVGGITTFLTMAYILAVNPSMLHDAGISICRQRMAKSISGNNLPSFPI